MSEDNFEWNDALILELLEFKKGFGKGFPKNLLLTQFKQSKQQSENKDWEILSFEMQGVIYQYDELGITNLPLFLTNKGFKIHSVKRLSDNEVFSIENAVDIKIGAFNKEGWQRYTGKITGFIIIGGSLFIECGTCSGGLMDAISLKQYEKQPLFTTEDGKDIFEGDMYWTLEPETWSLYYSGSAGEESGSTPNRKYFSTEEKATEYILYNKPVLSLRDIWNVFNEHLGGGFFASNCKNDLAEIVKEKINQ